MRNFIELIAKVSQDSDQFRNLLDIDTAVDDTDASTASTFFSTQMTLAAGATGVQVPFGGVTHASMVLILAYQDIAVQMNNIAAPSVQVLHTPAVASASVLSTVQKYDQPGFVLWRGRVDSLYLTNLSSTATASVFVALVGEAP